MIENCLTGSSHLDGASGSFSPDVLGEFQQTCVYQQYCLQHFINLCAAVCRGVWASCFIHRILSQGFDPMNGVRIGEASHPGPIRSRMIRDSCDITLAVTNIGSVLRKMDHVHKLMESSHVVVLAETCVTQASLIVQSQCRASRTTAILGAPVATKDIFEHCKSEYRGANAGTACFSQLPCREMFLEDPPFAYTCGRLTPAIVRLGPIDVLLVCVCLMPGSGKSKANDEIISQAITLISTSGLPAILAGDFNEPPSAIGSMSKLVQEGYVEIFSWSEQHLHHQLPPTCNDTTRNDSMVIHPFLVPFIKHAWVDPLLKIDVHTPLFVQFHFDTSIPVLPPWRVPIQWECGAFDQNKLAECYHSVRSDRIDTPHPASDQAICDAFQHWSSRVESAVHRATASASHLKQGLRPNQKGRCTWDYMRNHRPATCVRQGGDGVYNPPAEAFRLTSILKIRQTRRIQALYRSVRAAPQTFGNNPPVTLCNQWKMEWCAILNAKGYGNSWPNWVMRHPGFVCVPFGVPSTDELHDFLQLNQHDSDAAVRAEHVARKEKWSNRLKQDAKKGDLRSQFSGLKGASTSQLHWLERAITAPARLLRCNKGLAKLSCGQAHKFRIGVQATFGSCRVLVVERSYEILSVQTVSGFLPVSDNLVQHVSAVQTAEIDQFFHDHWYPLWNRDCEQPRTYWHEACEFANGLNTRMPVAVIPWESPTAWEEVISRTKSGSVSGSDGWRYQELKVLPRLGRRCAT